MLSFSFSVVKDMIFFIFTFGISLLYPFTLTRLADHGHYVVGIEGVSKACEDFFKENEIKYTETNMPEIADGKLFKVLPVSVVSSS